jgi:hypothetical protein
MTLATQAMEAFGISASSGGKAQAEWRTKTHKDTDNFADK